MQTDEIVSYVVGIGDRSVGFVGAQVSSRLVSLIFFYFDLWWLSQLRPAP